MTERDTFEDMPGGTASPVLSGEVGRKRRVLFEASGVPLFLFALAALFVISRYSFLLFHVLAEFFSIAVAVAMFLIAWNTRRFMKNNYLLFLGIAYLFVGLIDLLHTLAYKGMGVFPLADADLPTQLWLAGRYLEAASLVVAPLLIGRKPRPEANLVFCAGVTALLLGSIFLGYFPDAFIPGSGLTAFKVGSEYAVCLALIVAGALLWNKREYFERSILWLVIAALAATICAELLFTFYIDVFGLSNLAGHYFKIVSFYLIYLAVIRRGLTDPYSLLFRRLSERERVLDESQFIAKVGGWELDLKTGKQRWTKETYRLHEVGPEFDPDLHGGLSFFHGENRRLIEEAVNRAATTGEPYDLELKMVTAKGNEIWVRAQGRAITDSRGKPRKLAGTIQDVTDWKRMQERLEKATEKAKASNRAKSDFLANMSHELRTPLTGILGMLETARNNAEDPKQRERIGMALKSAKTLLDIINDVLDISKIEAGVLELQMKPFELGELLDLAEATFAESARQKGLELKVRADDELPLAVVGDETRVRQIISNLLSNAIKFTESGSVMLDVRRVPRSDPGVVQLLFTVSDTGPGIPEDMLDEIFGKFTQAEHGRRIGGTGLGLSIVKRLVRAMAGEVNVDSAPGRGASIHFDLKLAPADAAQAKQETDDSPVAREAPASLRVLVVEDDDASRMVASKHLETMGHDVTSVGDGESAIAALGETAYDMVLLDMNLPDMDGEKLVRKVRSGEAGGKSADAAFIAVTGRAMAGDRERLLESGLDGYVAKPLGPEELRAELRRVAANRS